MKTAKAKGVKCIIVTPDQVLVRLVKNFQSVIGGWLESLPVGDDFTVVIDENGKSKRLPKNELADSIVRAMLEKKLGLSFRTRLSSDPLVGPAIFVGIDEDGEASDLPDVVVREFFSDNIQLESWHRTDHPTC